MYIEDLSPFIRSKNTFQPWRKSRKEGVAVGWLDVAVPYSKGNPPMPFVAALRTLARSPQRITRGFHRCPFCEEHRGESVPGENNLSDEVTALQGNGEIHVRSKTRGIFIAPALIYHYVSAHNYLPPQDFIHAVLQAVSNEHLNAGEAEDS